MKAIALASGSNGNAYYVETADARLLIDVGLSGKRLQERAETRGVDLHQLDAVLLSHDHGDHTHGAGVVHRRFDVPIYATSGTFRYTQRRMGKVVGRCRFHAGEELWFGRTRVQTIPTPHDGADGACFVIESEGRRLGIMTDLGHDFSRLYDTVATLDGAVLEANYDRELLAWGPYPWHLKERIAGRGGHLSNDDCVRIAAEASTGRLRKLMLCHLSGTNNTPAAALDTASQLGSLGVEVTVATRTEASDPLNLP